MNIAFDVKKLSIEYRASLKSRAAEEPIDLIMFRPLGFVLSRSLKSTAIRPLHISILSMIIGIAGGILIAVAGESGLLLAAAFIWFSTLLDCSDGQLARLQKTASPTGRILDGMIDYAVSVAIFVGIGIRGAPGIGQAAWWGVVTAAGASYAIQAAMYDLFRTEYLSAIKDGSGAKRQRKYRIVAEPRRRGVAQWAYQRYAGLQRFLGSWLGAIRDDEMTRRHLRLWGLNGTSTHVLALVAASLFNRLDLYLMYLVIVGNGLMLSLILAWHGRTRESTVQSTNTQEVS